MKRNCNLCEDEVKSRGLCIKHYGKWYYSQNKERILKRNKQYAKKNREKINERARKHYHKNREKIIKKVANSAVCIPYFGTKKGVSSVYVNGEKENFPPEKIKEIKDKVLRDCIKNPKKYLKDEKVSRNG